MDKKLVTKIFVAFNQQNSHPTTELIYTTPFELLIAVMLSAQATDTSVNKVTKVLFKYANTPQKILALRENKLKNYIKTIGLYNNKAKNIIKTCKILINHFAAVVPNNREDLELLPGVGRKTANVLLNEVFGKPTIAVDTHVLRVANRIGFVASKSPLKVEQQLEQLIPKRFKLKAHMWLILHGRYVCKAKKPDCKNCVIIHLCNYTSKRTLCI
jgi:endonuclease-3